MIEYIISWADQILFMCSLFFAISQVKQLRYSYNKKQSGMDYISLIIFVVVVWVMAITYGVIGLTHSSYMVSISASLWTVLLIMRFKYKS